MLTLWVCKAKNIVGQVEEWAGEKGQKAILVWGEKNDRKAEEEKKNMAHIFARNGKVNVTYAHFHMWEFSGPTPASYLCLCVLCRNEMAPTHTLPRRHKEHLR